MKSVRVRARWSVGVDLGRLSGAGGFRRVEYDAGVSLRDWRRAGLWRWWTSNKRGACASFLIASQPSCQRVTSDLPTWFCGRAYD